LLPPLFWGQRLPSLVFIALAAGLFLLSAIRPDNMHSIRTGVADAFAPLLVTINKPIQTVADYARAVSGLATLQKDNARLRQENAKLREWYQRALVLQSENESLQTLLNIKLPPQESFVTARIIADSGSTYARTVLVLAGARDGIEKGQAVLGGDGLVGRIIEAGETTARVLLMTDINARVPVFVEGPNVRAIAAGNGSDTPALIHLPPDIVPPEGARVITSGHGGLFPYGLPVGTVMKDAQGQWAVRPATDIDRAIHVRIVNGNDDPNLHSAP
jgi:rod shape-determining protein MreC